MFVSLLFLYHDETRVFGLHKIEIVLLTQWCSCFQKRYEETKAGGGFLRLLLCTDKPVCHHFTSRENMTALWSKVKRTLAEQCASMVHLFQWNISCLLGVKGNVMEMSWMLGISPGYVCMCVCTYVHGYPAMETDVVHPHPFCLSNFLFNLSLIWPVQQIT